MITYPFKTSLYNNAFLNGTVKIESKENVSIIEITQITAVEPAPKTIR